MRKRAGILGGMGPEATAMLFNLIVKLTKAEKDQDHVTSIVFNYPQIPDRTAAIFGKGPSALPYLIEGAKLLENAGADFIAMPCVTANYFYNDIVKHIKIPFIHLVEEILRYVTKLPGSPKRIGLLATVGTIHSGLFQEAFGRNGREIVVPGKESQELFRKAIYQEKGLKTGYKREPKKMLLEVIRDLQRRHRPEAIIAGCTELPLVLRQSDVDVPLIDPLRVLAEEIIRAAGCELRVKK